MTTIKQIKSFLSDICDNPQDYIDNSIVEKGSFKTDLPEECWTIGELYARLKKHGINPDFVSISTEWGLLTIEITDYINDKAA